jgi:4-hydroxythreonine-4-phosphate dehydrogenase
VLFAPAFPAQGRRVRCAQLYVNDRIQPGDLRALLVAAGYPTAHVERRGSLRAALAAGARALVCDADSDADLDAIARAGLALRPRPLFAGSAGLARAIARTLPRHRSAPVPPVSARPIVTVVGSASPVSVRQAHALSKSRALGPQDLLVHLLWSREPRLGDRPVARRLGRLVAEGAPRAHYVLTGGETARALLGALGLRRLRQLGEVEPGVPFGVAAGGTLVCTKAGGFGSPDTLVRCAAKLKRFAD